MRSGDARRLLFFAGITGILTAGGIEASRPPPPSRALQLTSPAPPSRQARATGARRVEIAGCRTVIAGPAGAGPAVCEVPLDGRLHVWVDAGDTEDVTIFSNGGDAAPRPLPPGRGRLFHVHVRPEAPFLDVVTSPSTGARRGPRVDLTFALAPARSPDALDALVDLRRSDPAAAERRAARLLTSDELTTRARATGLVARVRRDRGDLEGAATLLATAIERDRLAGRISDLYADSFALAYTRGVQLGQFEEARAVLAALAPLEGAALSSPQHEAHARYYAALVAHEAGDLRAALDHYRASREGAARIEDLRHRADVLSQEARVLLDLGRAAEGAALYDEAAPLAAELDPCARATFFNNWASYLLDAGEASADPPARAPDEPLASALALVPRACPSDRLRGYVAMNLAQVSLRSGDPAAARAAIDTAASLLSASDKHDAAELADVRARVAMAQGDLRTARDAYETLAEIADGAVLPRYRRRAALGRAELLDHIGDDVGAAAAHEELARIVTADSKHAPLGEGRLGFLEQLGRSASRHVAFLLRRPGGAALAASVARRSIAHMLSSLETVDRIAALSGEERRAWEASIAAYRKERARIEDEARGDWKLSSIERARAADARRAREERARTALDEALAAAGASPRRALQAPAENELFLVYFPTGDAEWVGFAIEPAGVTARTLPEGSPAERYLAPFRAEIERARHVRFFAPRALHTVDFHALPFGSGPLVERVAVTYGLDVRAPASPSPDAPRAPGAERALVVADPQGTLPDARDEGEMVRGELAARGLVVSLLTAREPGRASHAEVRAALDRGSLSLLHFAGHASFSGNDGWDSAIPLADGGALRVSDVLSLRSAPRLVVLSGCETGRADGLGLAHAFVAAGALAAVGVTRIVPDGDAHDVMRLFYASLHEHAPEDAPTPGAAAEALRSATRKLLRNSHARPAWQSFRVFVP